MSKVFRGLLSRKRQTSKWLMVKRYAFFTQKSKLTVKLVQSCKQNGH